MTEEQITQPTRRRRPSTRRVVPPVQTDESVPLAGQVGQEFPLAAETGAITVDRDRDQSANVPSGTTLDQAAPQTSEAGPMEEPVGAPSGRSRGRRGRGRGRRSPSAPELAGTEAAEEMATVTELPPVPDPAPAGDTVAPPRSSRREDGALGRRRPLA